MAKLQLDLDTAGILHRHFLQMRVCMHNAKEFDTWDKEWDTFWTHFHEIQERHIFGWSDPNSSYEKDMAAAYKATRDELARIGVL
jgi:hypothetical protein